MFKKFVLLYIVKCVCFAPQSSFAQLWSNEKMDSVKVIAFRNTPDSNSVKAFSELIRYYFNLGKYDSARIYALRSLPVAQKVNDKKQLGRMYYNAGIVYTNLTIYDSAKYYLDLGESICRETADTALLINTLNANALACNYRSDFAAAVEHLLKASHLMESSSNPQLRNMLPQNYGNIGHNLIAENQIEKGIEYEKKALLIKNYPDEQRHSVMIHLDIADAYILLNQNAAAKLHLDTAILINKNLDNIYLKSMVLNTEGHYYDVTNNPAAALAAYLTAYKIADSTKNDYLKAEVGDNVARMYSNLGNQLQAEKYALESNTISKLLNNYKVAASTYNTLKKSAIAKGDFPQALKFSELNKLYADSASNSDSKKTILNLEAKYQNQKKENEIADLTLTKTANELALVKRNRLMLIGGVAAVSLLLVLGLLFRNSKQKNLIAEKENSYQQEQIKFLERQQQIVSLQSMVNGQETERTRIAKDLHDGLGGLFSTIKMHLSTLQHEKNELKAYPLFTKSYDMINTASEEVRRIAHNMMPEVLIKLGLADGLNDMCNNISSGKLLKVTFQPYGMEKRLNASTEIMLYRIIQELLNNIIKHSQATEALVQFNRDGNRLHVTVEDNGRGFNTLETAGNNHAGLETVQSRVDYLNGKLSIESQQGLGTTIMMEFLINEK